MSEILRLENVTKIYKPNIRALNGVSFSVQKGEFIFLTGPSGAGKSTLLNLIFRAERPTSGEIYFDGRPLSSYSKREIPLLRRQIGFVFQDFKLLPHRTIFENVAIPLEVLGMAEGEIRRRVLIVLEQVGLAGKEQQLVDQLSGGEKQRVCLARAVINHPPILLADEPTGNLDSKRTEEVMEIFENLNAQGTTILLDTYDQSLFIDRQRRILVLDEGRIINL